jgi:hypothetical protein
VLHRLISVERGSVAVRVEACCVLMDASDDERAAGALQLERLAFAPGRPSKDRLWPLYRLVEVGDPVAQRHAVHRMVGTVMCTTDTAVLAYAVVLLANLGLHDEARKGLLLRAAWRWHDTQTQTQALDLFGMVSHDSRSVNDDDALALVGVAEAAVDHVLRDSAMSWQAQVTAARRMLWALSAPAAIDEVVRRLLADRAIPAQGRILLAGDMLNRSPRHAEALAALAALAGNEQAPGRLRLVAACVMFPYVEPDVAVRQVATWAGDQRLSLWLRARSALLLARWFGEYDQTIEQLAGARSLLLRGLRRYLRYEGALRSAAADREDDTRVPDDAAE